MAGAMWSAGMLIPFQLNAQIEFKSIQDVLDYADEHAIAIQSAEIAEKIAIAEKKEARSYLLPAAYASAGYNDNIQLQPTLLPAQIINPEAPAGTYEEITFGKRYLYSATYRERFRGAFR
jgi:hypothetical protein